MSWGRYGSEVLQWLMLHCLHRALDTVLTYFRCYVLILVGLISWDRKGSFLWRIHFNPNRQVFFSPSYNLHLFSLAEILASPLHLSQVLSSSHDLYTAGPRDKAGVLRALHCSFPLTLHSPFMKSHSPSLLQEVP